jgi:predicted DCC family thiol-disulfide oxidoreductase YuxK
MGRMHDDSMTVQRDRIERPVLLYSGTCRFCRWAARMIARIDRGERVALLPLADAAAEQLLAGIPDERRAESWWIVGRDGTPIASKKGAAIVLLTEIPSLRGIGRSIARLGFAPVLDAVDRWVAGHRKALSRFVPDGAGPRRYP